MPEERAMDVPGLHREDTVGANRLERRRQKYHFLKSLYRWFLKRYQLANFFKDH
jgi:hypothetical protein